MRSVFPLVLLLLATTSFGASSPESASTRHDFSDFTIPESNATVKVHMLNSFLWTIPLFSFINPDSPVSTTNTTDLLGLAFMLEHPSGRRVMFDIGLRKDTENLSPAALKILRNPDGTFGPAMEDDDIPTQIKRAGIDLHTIDTVIWSHSHFDHIGDMTLFPNETNLVVGPGTLADTQPTYPDNPNSLHVKGDFAGRNVSEVSFNGHNVAGQASHDFFGDGSVYLIDLPGHITGHMGALVRVTSNPSTFILLAGDSVHHVGLIRPNPGVRLLCNHQHQLPVDLQKIGEPDFADPFVQPTRQNTSIHVDAVTATVSAGKVQRFDARADTWVIVAHDGSFTPFLNKTDGIPLFPGTINDWHQKGFKEMTRFAYLESGNTANFFKNTPVMETHSNQSSKNSTCKA